MGQNKDREITYQLSVGKINFIQRKLSYCQLELEQDGEKQWQKLKQLPPHAYLPGLNFTPPFPAPPSTSSAGKRGCGQSLTVLLLLLPPISVSHPHSFLSQHFAFSEAFFPGCHQLGWPTPLRSSKRSVSELAGTSCVQHGHTAPGFFSQKPALQIPLCRHRDTHTHAAFPQLKWNINSSLKDPVCC